MKVNWLLMSAMIIQRMNSRVNWESFLGKPWKIKSVTAVPLKRIKELGAELEKLPEGFVVATAS